MKRICILLGVLLGVIAISLLWIINLPKGNSLDAYLLNSIQNISKQHPSNREEFIINSSLFDGISEFTNLSTESEKYYWFTIPTEIKSTDKIFSNSNFNGFFISLSKEGYIKNFGYHKP